MAKKLKLTRLRIYPVKALEGMDVDAWELDRFGLKHDRRWMVVDSSGRCVTRREQPSLAEVTAEIVGDRLILSARHLPSVELPVEPDPGPTEPATIGSESIAVRDISDDASRWLSEWLRTACRLVYLPEARARSLDPAVATRKGDLALQDELPLQILTAASVADLNQRLGEDLPIEALRPNFVIEGAPAYDDDTWRAIRIAGVEIRMIKPWAHRAIVRPGQTTDGSDIIGLLGSYRGRGDEAFLGQLAVHVATTGTLRIGEAVEVLERGDPPAFGAAEPEEAEDAQEAQEVEEARGSKPARRKKPVDDDVRVRVISLPESRRPKGSSGSDLDEELPWEVGEEEPDTGAVEEEAVVEVADAETEPAGAAAEEEPPKPAAGPAGPVEEVSPAARVDDAIEVVADRKPEAAEVARLLLAAAVTESKSEAKRLTDACLRAPVLVTAWNGGSLVGLLRGWTDEVRDGFIADVAVHPDHHGSGAAQDLVRHAVGLHPDIRWVLRASPGSAYLGSALGWHLAGSGWYLSPR